MAVFNMDKLIEYFLKFPGIGPRQAKRFAYFIAAQDESYVKNLAELILKVKRNSRTCVGCFRIFDAAGDGRLCDICSSPSRGGSIMVVEKNVDLENIEKQLCEFTSKKKTRPFFPWKLYFAEGVETSVTYFIARALRKSSPSW